MQMRLLICKLDTQYANYTVNMQIRVKVLLQYSSSATKLIGINPSGWVGSGEAVAH